MMTQSTAPTVSAATHSRMQAREEAAWAMHLAARSLAIEPAALSTAAYRTFRATQEEPGLPSPLAISLLFVGWQRACEHVAALTCDETEVEADVVRALYGDPAGRQRARATCGQRSRAQLGEIARQTGRRVRRGDIVSETARIGCAPSDCPESESDARDRT